MGVDRTRHRNCKLLVGDVIAWGRLRWVGLSGQNKKLGTGEERKYPYPQDHDEQPDPIDMG